MRILDLIDLNYGDTLKQGDSTRLRFQLSARDYLLPDNEGKQARIVFHFNNSIVHEEYSTVQRGNVVEFSINEILPPNVYVLEIHVDGQIFPSDDYIFKIKLSAAGIDHEITKSYGINNIIERAVDLVSAKFINLTKEKLGLGNVINVKQASEVEVSQARGSYPTLAERLNGTDDKQRQTTAQLAQKINKGEVSVYDIDKNKGKFDQTYMSEELLQQMAGDTPINAVPADKSITTHKIADKAVTTDHTSFIDKSTNLYNKEKDLIGYIVNDEGEIVESVTGAYRLSDYIKVNPDELYFLTSVPTIGEYDEGMNFLRRIDVQGGDGTEFTTSSDAYYLRLNVQVTRASYPEARLNKGGELPYEPYYVKIDGLAVDGEYIEDNSVSFKKRTRLGDSLKVMLSKSYESDELPNYDTTSKKFTFPQTIFLIVGNERYTVSGPFEIDLSTVLASNNGAMVYFNTKNETFHAFFQTDLRGVTDDMVLFATISCDTTTRRVLALNISCPITIDGKVENDSPKEEPNKPFAFSVEKLIGRVSDFDLPGIGDEGSPFDYVNDNHELVYGLFDDLMNQNPSYITRSELGLSGKGNPIYEYKFSPVRAGDVKVKPYPELSMGAAIHGGEGLAVAALYYFMERICNDWKNDEQLEYLRHNINFSIIPLKNPDDYDTKSYNGVDNINLNRDFDWNWTQGADTGETPFTRVESQLLRDYFHANKDKFIHHIDMHVRGGRQVVTNDKTMWLSNSTREQAQFGANVIEQMTRRWQKKYGQLPDDIIMGYNTVTSGERTNRGYIHNVVGIPATTWEGFSASTTMTEVENKDVVDMNVDFLAQYVVDTIKYYQDK